MSFPSWQKFEIMQIKPICALLSYLFKIHHCINLVSMPRSSEQPLPGFGFPNQNHTCISLVLHIN